MTPVTYDCCKHEQVTRSQGEGGGGVQRLRRTSLAGYMVFIDGGNTGNGVKIASEVIGSRDEIEFSEELKELLPNEAGKESNKTEV
ncbi:hypothetical protein Tco_0269716 [Tanacetum coccineum]